MCEINEGWYRVVLRKPVILGDLDTIPKANSDILLIHDKSRPKGKGLNSFVVIEEKLKFETVTWAENLLGRGYYMAKVDLKGVYCAVLKLDIWC